MEGTFACRKFPRERIGRASGSGRWKSSPSCVIIVGGSGSTRVGRVK